MTPEEIADVQEATAIINRVIERNIKGSRKFIITSLLTAAVNAILATKVK